MNPKYLPQLIHRINSELPLLAIDCDDKMHLWAWTYHCIESDMFESWEEALTDWMSWAVKNLNSPDGIDSPQGREIVLAALMSMIEGLETQSKEYVEETVVDTFDPSSFSSKNSSI